MTLRRIYLLILLVCSNSIAVCAEQVVLKNGETFESVIIEENARYIKVNRFGVNVTYFRNEIEHVMAQDLLINFVSTVRDLDREVEQYLDKHSDQINHFSADTQKINAIAIVLEETKFINEKIVIIQKMSPPSAGQALKTLMLEYYQSMIELQAAVLKYLADTPQADELVKQRTMVMIDKEKQFQEELKNNLSGFL